VRQSERQAKLTRIASSAAAYATVGHPKFPWRSRTTPYRTLIAEFFLQRTGAVQAQGPYQAFMARFPSFQQLSRAPEAELLGLLAPLGLRHKARTFVRLVRALEEKHSGRVPCEEAALLALPGVGRYKRWNRGRQHGQGSLQIH